MTLAGNHSGDSASSWPAFFVSSSFSAVVGGTRNFFVMCRLGSLCSGIAHVSPVPCAVHSMLVRFAHISLISKDSVAASRNLSGICALYSSLVSGTTDSDHTGKFIDVARGAHNSRRTCRGFQQEGPLRSFQPVWASASPALRRCVRVFLQLHLSGRHLALFPIVLLAEMSVSLIWVVDCPSCCCGWSWYCFLGDALCCVMYGSRLAPFWASAGLLVRLFSSFVSRHVPGRLLATLPTHSNFFSGFREEGGAPH